MYDPGADLADRYAHWVWRRRFLRGVPEVLCRRRNVILTERSQSRAESRSALAHAVAHLDLGHGDVISPELEAREELQADRLAARRTIGVQALADALLWSEHPREAAEQLQVTEHLLWVRLRHLHPSERGYLRRRLSMKEQSA